MTAEQGATNARHRSGGTRWPWVVGGLAALLAGGGFFLALSAETSRREVLPPPPPLVQTARVTAAESLTIRQTGFIRPVAEIAVASEITGRIAEVSSAFRRGNIVSEGALLFRLETARLDAAVSRAEAGVARAEAALAEAQVARERQADLQEREFATERALQQAIVAEAAAEADVATTRAELVTARTRLDDSIVRAPFDALVLSSDADIGDLATAGSTLGRLVAADAVEIDFGLTPGDLALIGDPARAIGASLALFAAELPTRAMDTARTPVARGVVLDVGPAIDAQTRTVPLVVRVPDPFARSGLGRPLRIDELVLMELSVTLTGAPAMEVPIQALQDGGIVWQVVAAEDERHLRRVAVDVLQRNDGRAIVQADLAVDAHVMVSALSQAADGLAIRVQDDDAPSDQSAAPQARLR